MQMTQLFAATLFVLVVGVFTQADYYRKLDLHDESINDLRRRIDKIVEARQMQEEQLKNAFSGCTCTEGPQGPKGERGFAGLPGPPGFPGAQGRRGSAFEWETDGEFCMVIIGESCPRGFSPNHAYDRELQLLSEAITLRSCCK